MDRAAPEPNAPTEAVITIADTPPEEPPASSPAPELTIREDPAAAAATAQESSSVAIVEEGSRKRGLENGEENSNKKQKIESGGLGDTSKPAVGDESKEGEEQNEEVASAKEGVENAEAIANGDSTGKGNGEKEKLAKKLAQPRAKSESSDLKPETSAKDKMDVDKLKATQDSSKPKEEQNGGSPAQKTPPKDRMASKERDIPKDGNASKEKESGGPKESNTPKSSPQTQPVEEEYDSDDAPLDLAAMSKFEYEQVARLTPAQLRRYEQYRRSDLKNAKVKKVLVSLNPIMAKSSEQYVIAVKGLAKLFVGDVVETALEVRKSRGERGALQPKHLREAFRRLRRRGVIPYPSDKATSFE